MLRIDAFDQLSCTRQDDGAVSESNPIVSTCNLIITVVLFPYIRSIAPGAQWLKDWLVG